MTNSSDISSPLTALVILELDGGNLSLVNLKVMSALTRLREFINLDVDVLIAGRDCAEAAKTAALFPDIRQVLVADADACAYQLPENLAPWLADHARKYSYVLVGATTFGKNLLPCVAALLDCQPITDVVAIDSASVFKRNIYAGNGLATVTTNQPIKFLSIRTSAFSAIGLSTESAAIVAIEPPPVQAKSRFIKQEDASTARPELTSARVVISGGRGMQSGDNFNLLYRLADKLGAAVGASRAAVDAGYAANDMQVGQTGKMVAPELYIAVGLSGAVQHIAGMRDAKIIVAINKDPDAPIFNLADYGLVADLFEALPELIELL
jgi:electron transfer flavoprotein alpha subunit